MTRTLGYMDVGVLLGAIGTATGVGSLSFTAAAWTIERRDRKGEMAQERKLREAEAERDRKRFEIDMAEHRARQRAEITAVQRGSDAESIQFTAYDFMLRNLGPSWAKHVHAWLEDESTNQVISNEAALGALDVREHAECTLRVSNLIVQGRGPFALWVKWSDESGGPYSERSNLEVRLN